VASSDIWIDSIILPNKLKSSQEKRKK